MSKMGRYCKAYPAEALRAFPNWAEKTPPLHLKVEKKAEGEGGPVSEEASQSEEPLELDYYYIQEDYTVTAGVFLNENVAFEDISDEWKEFCTKELKFEIPQYEPVAAAETMAAGAAAVAQST